MASANNAKKGANVRMKRKERKNIAEMCIRDRYTTGAAGIFTAVIIIATFTAGAQLITSVSYTHLR